MPSPKSSLVQGSRVHIPRGPRPECKPLLTQELLLVSPGQGGRSQALDSVAVQV